MTEVAGTDARGWKRGLRRRVKEFAELRRRVKRRFGILAPMRVFLYGGYGTSSAVTVRGRVLEEAPGAAPTAHDPVLSNFRRAFSLFESDEVSDVELELSACGGSARVVSDDDGYFCARLELPSPAKPGWLPIRAEVVRSPYPLSEPASGEGAVLIPAPEARFGVISDIDDTILRTYVRRKAKMVYLTLLGNALTRMSFDGTVDLYQGLWRAGLGAPFFYVSHSMWNIFPLLDDFIAHQGLPRGPLLLRDVSWLRERTEPPHKPQAISDLIATYPRLPFILLGDSGERDLQIYLDVARRHPGRVLAILIRNVSSASDLEVLNAQLRSAADLDCPTIVFEESSQAIERCRELGFWAGPGEAALDMPRS